MNRRLIAAVALVAAPAIALASGGAAPANPWLDIVFKFVNFAGLIAILYFALRKMVPQQLKDRREGIARELNAALEAKEAAEAKLADYQRRVSELEKEAARMREDFKAEGEAQKAAIIRDAGIAAENIRKNAAAAGEREARRISDELRTEAVRQALALAEEILKKSYGADDQKNALEQTIKKIEGLH